MASTSFNNNSSSILSMLSDSNLLKISTHNIQGFTNRTKQFQILQQLELSNIDICGLCETNLSQEEALHVKHNNSKQFSYFFESYSHSKGSGVELMVSNRLSSHIFNHEGYKGHSIFIDL